jgi:hypothetical protein
VDVVGVASPPPRARVFDRRWRRRRRALWRCGRRRRSRSWWRRRRRRRLRLRLRLRARCRRPWRGRPRTGPTRMARRARGRRVTRVRGDGVYGDDQLRGLSATDGRSPSLPDDDAMNPWACAGRCPVGRARAKQCQGAERNVSKLKPDRGRRRPENPRR